MIDRLAFLIMQVLALITASVLTVLARFINDAEKNLQIESMAMSNWFLFYSTLEDLPPEVRQQVLMTGKIILVYFVIILMKRLLGVLYGN